MSDNAVNASTLE